MKQERHATTLAEDLQEASANTAEYGEFFTGLTGITDRKPVDDALGERIQGYVLGWLEGHPLTAFAKTKSNSLLLALNEECCCNKWNVPYMIKL